MIICKHRIALLLALAPLAAPAAPNVPNTMECVFDVVTQSDRDAGTWATNTVRSSYIIVGLAEDKQSVTVVSRYPGGSSNDFRGMVVARGDWGVDFVEWNRTDNRQYFSIWFDHKLLNGRFPAVMSYHHSRIPQQAMGSCK